MWCGFRRLRDKGVSRCLRSASVARAFALFDRCVSHCCQFSCSANEEHAMSKERSEENLSPRDKEIDAQAAALKARLEIALSMLELHQDQLREQDELIRATR